MKTSEPLKANFTFKDEDLNVFIHDGQIRTQLMLESHFENRKRTNYEYWLIDTSGMEDKASIDDAMNNLNLDFDDDVFLFDTINPETVKVKELYRIHESMPVSLLDYLTWSGKNGWQGTSLSKWQRRRNMKQAPLKIGGLPSKPYLYDFPEGDKINGKQYFNYGNPAGQFADVFLDLQAILNFTYTLEKPDDKAWGIKYPNGSWNGMIRMLQFQEIDIGNGSDIDELRLFYLITCFLAVTDYTVTMERAEVMTFSIPLTQIFHSFFIKNPSDFFNFKAYVQPLLYPVWLTLAGFCAVTPPVLYLASK